LISMQPDRARGLTSRFRDGIFIDRCIYWLARSRFDFVQQLSMDRLQRYPDNYGALYILALCAYYRKDRAECFDNYAVLASKYRLRRADHRWFIKATIAFILYKGKNYSAAAAMCDRLLPHVAQRSPRLVVLKYCCYARHMLGDHKGVLAASAELRQLGFIDGSLIRFEQSARNALYSDS
jgi:hypothetical protein